MKITNKFNLPEPFIKAVEGNFYTPGTSDISVTQLIASPQEVALKKKYFDRIEEDASTRMWALDGSSVHAILEKAAQQCTSYEAEKRLYTDVLGWKVSGQFDLFDKVKHILYDYKKVSVWEVINGLKPEKQAQLNLLATIAENNGYKIDQLCVVAMMRDWSPRRSDIEDNYPEVPVIQFRIPFWPREKRVEYLRTRVELHQHAQQSVDVFEGDGFIDLPECTLDEKYEQPTKFAIMKKGAKRALKLCLSEEEAREYIKNHIDKELYKSLSLEKREGKPEKCLRYCPVAKFCKQFYKWRVLNGSSK